MRFTATRLPDNPIIMPHMDARMGANINGPSLIRVPSWLPNPLGRYYLYFADHGGKYIRLAFADHLAGPWKTHEPGTVALEQSHFIGHIASPDVHVDEVRRRIVMYFHGVTAAADLPAMEAVMIPAGYPLPVRQNSRVALSSNGIDFKVLPAIEPPYYLRVFQHGGTTYGLGMPGFFFRSRDGLASFEPGPRFFTDAMRHNALLLEGDTLHVFYSNAGDCPESILHSEITLTEDWTRWRPSPPRVVLAPETSWEGADQPLEPSRRGSVRHPVRQLRDPAVFRDNDGKLYLLYSGAGESCIAIAAL